MIHESEIEIPWCAVTRRDSKMVSARCGPSLRNGSILSQDRVVRGVPDFVHVVRIVGRTWLQRYNTRAGDRLRPDVAEAEKLARECKPTAQPCFPSDESSK